MPTEVMLEFADIDLGDERLNRRAPVILDALVASPSASLAEACGSPAATKAAHRFFENPKVTPEGLIEPHSFRTADRCNGLPVVLAPQDVTTLDFTGRAIEGLGHLERKFMRGVLVNTGIFVSPAGEMLGVAYQEAWARDTDTVGKSKQSDKRSFEQKESARCPP